LPDHIHLFNIHCLDFCLSVQMSSSTQNPTPSTGRPPALQPTAAPTVSAMGAGSLRPDSTARPTSSANPANSPAPDGSPSAMAPSAAPSSSPAPTITSKPTSIVAPSSACETEDGFFGSLVGSQVIVSFGYELETDPGTQGDLISDVLPPLEKAFNDFLLPTLFPAECGTSRRLDMARRRLLIRGISARPDDSPMDDVVCSQVKVVGNNCVVIFGELSLLVDDQRRLNDERKVQDSLKQGMEDDVFISAHESIDRVTYVDLGGNPAKSDGGTDSITQSDDGLNGILVGFVVAAAGTALIVTTAIVYRRRKNSDDADQTTTILSDVPLPAQSQSEEDTEQPSDADAEQLAESNGPISEQPSESSVYVEDDSSAQQSSAVGAFPTASSSFLAASPSADTVRVNNVINS